MSNFAPMYQSINYGTSNNYSSSLNNNELYTTNGLNKSYGQNDINMGFEKTQEYSPHNTTSLANTVLKGFIEPNEISILFFSNDNIKRIQKKIKLAVYNESEGKFKLDEDQDENDLIIVMRYIYLEKCKNLPNNVVRQVKILNEQTVEYILPDLITNIKQYYGYIKDITTPLMPMDRPLNVNRAGRRTNPSTTTIWQ